MTFIKLAKPTFGSFVTSSWLKETSSFAQVFTKCKLKLTKISNLTNSDAIKMPFTKMMII